MAKQKNIVEIIDFGDLPVFQGATTYPCILRIATAGNAENPSISATTVTTMQFGNLNEYIEQHKKSINRDSLDDEGWHLGSETEQALLKKLQNTGVLLGEYVKGKIFIGVKTGFNEAFIIDKNKMNELINENSNSTDLIKPYIMGRNIKRYGFLNTEKYLIFTKRGIDIDKYPAIKKHLLGYKDRLTPKPKDCDKGNWKGRKQGSYKWYEIQDAVDYYKEFESDKIVYAEISTTGNFTIDSNNCFVDMTAFSLSSSDKYLLGILNSSLCKFFFSKISSEIRGGFLRWKRQYVEKIPVKKIDRSNRTESELHEEIVKSVETMLQLNKEKQQTTTPDKLDQLNTRIQYTDDRINKLVYQLYGLSEEEVGIVDGRQKL